MSARESLPLHGAMSGEDRRKLVVSLQHDVRQPQHSMEMGLRTLRLIVAELRARRFNDSIFDHLLKRIALEIASVESASRQIADVQQDLFDALNFEFDDSIPQPRIVVLDDVVERVLKSNRVLADNIRLRAGRSRLSFVSDSRCVERILNNLVVNAILHAGASKIFVGARRSGDDIALEVRDNGVGLDPRTAATLEGPLLWPPHTTRGHPAGRSGLGLYNVRLFTHRLGGVVTCTSSTRGTLIRVVLPGPFCREASPTLVPRSPRVDSPRGTLVALLAADVSLVRRVEQYFELSEIEVYGDHDALRWLSVVTDLKLPPDLVILDFQIKGQDCSLLLDIVRRRWSDQPVKVLVIGDEIDGPALLAVSNTAPILKRPLTKEKLDSVVGILAGETSLPRRGFL